MLNFSKNQLTALHLATASVLTLSMALIMLLFMALGLGRANPSRSQLLYISAPVLTDDGEMSSLVLHDLRAGVRYTLIDAFLGWGTDAAWSPDGQRIVYSAFEAGRVKRNLHVINVLTGETRRLIDTDASTVTDHNSASWSPDGRYIAYHAVNPQSASLDIYVYDLTTDTVHLAYAGPGNDIAPVWSPAGPTLVIQSTQPPHWMSSILLLDVNTWTLTPLVDDTFANVNPAWSPDGREIVFASNRHQTERSNPFGLYVVDVASGNMRQLGNVEMARLPDFAWSSDGYLIALTLHTGGQSQIFTIHAEDGGDLRQRTFSSPGYRQPHWRP